MEATDYKCPACNAPLTYKPESESWRCEYCNSNYKLEDLEKNEKEFEDLDNTRTIDVDEYTCENCGAKVVTDENTAATFCVYCGNTAIIKNRLTGMLKPKSVIPFKTTKVQAENAFLKFKKGKPFAPKEFGKKEQVEKITGVYIPFWLYDFEASGEVSGTAIREKTGYSGGQTYRKSGKYHVVRHGKSKFMKIPVDASAKVNDDIMDSIEPFDYNEIKEFTPAYLSGFLAEKYDVDVKTAYKRAEERVNNALKDYLRSDITGYESVHLPNVNINKKLKSTEYILFPIWLLNIKYKGEYHMFAMNGQTGRMVGNVPISKIKLYLCTIGLFLSVFSLVMLLILGIASIAG